jgi:lysozyme
MWTKKTIWFFVAAGAAIVLMSIVAYKKYLVPFLSSWEGFSATPYWDVSRWAWGYGTRVPGSVDNKYQVPTGTITKSKAMLDALGEVNKDYTYLKNLITVPLSARQWAALLSFAYNLGPGNADNLVPNINTQDMSALEIQWKKYIYAGGVVNSDLVERRNAEWDLYSS